MRARSYVEEDGGGRVEDVRGEAPEQPRAAHQRHGLADEITQAAARPPASAPPLPLDVQFLSMNKYASLFLFV